MTMRPHRRSERERGSALVMALFVLTLLTAMGTAGLFLSQHDARSGNARRRGTKALDLAEANDPELILMDIRMPVMDGLEATRRLRKMRKFAKVPIIALTASVGDEGRDKCLAAGCTEHLAKPIQSQELFEAMGRYLMTK